MAVCVNGVLGTHDTRVERECLLCAVLCWLLAPALSTRLDASSQHSIAQGTKLASLPNPSVTVLVAAAGTRCSEPQHLGRAPSTLRIVICSC
jgi:hypothetical protein